MPVFYHIRSRFWQVEIEQKDIEKIALTVENGHFEFIRMPFGRKNAPATFQRGQYSFRYTKRKVRYYMDNIIVYSSTINNHISQLSEIFNRLRKANSKIQSNKCKLVACLGI